MELNKATLAQLYYLARFTELKAAALTELQRRISLETNNDYQTKKA